MALPRQVKEVTDLLKGEKVAQRKVMTLGRAAEAPAPRSLDKLSPRRRRRRRRRPARCVAASTASPAVPTLRPRHRTASSACWPCWTAPTSCRPWMARPRRSRRAGPSRRPPGQAWPPPWPATSQTSCKRRRGARRGPTRGCTAPSARSWRAPRRASGGAGTAACCCAARPRCSATWQRCCRCCRGVGEGGVLVGGQAHLMAVITRQVPRRRVHLRSPPQTSGAATSSRPCRSRGWRPRWVPTTRRCCAASCWRCPSIARWPAREPSKVGGAGARLKLQGRSLLMARHRAPVLRRLASTGIRCPARFPPCRRAHHGAHGCGGRQPGQGGARGGGGGARAGHAGRPAGGLPRRHGPRVSGGRH